MYTIADISRIITNSNSTIASKSVSIRHLAVDTRKFNQGQEVLFFAISGKHNDGHKYLKDAFAKGCRNFVVEKEPVEDWLKTGEAQDSNVIVVDNAIKALQELAAYHRKQFDIPVIGITGSNGKTIVKEWLYQLLYRDIMVLRSPKSYNSQIGVPLSVWELTGDYELAIFEAGISQPNEMEYLEKVIQPTKGIFTNIGQAHQEGFADTESKVDEKLKLFKNCSELLYCKDYEVIVNQIREKKEEGFFTNPDFSEITFSHNSQANLKINELMGSAHKTLVKGSFAEKSITLEIPFTDNPSIENALICGLAVLGMGYPIEFIQEGIKHLAPVEMRLELKKGINDCTLINDTYNSDLVSLQLALDYLSQQHQHSQKTLILSDILQSGRDEDQLYKEVSQILKNKGVHRLIGIGPAISRQKKLFNFDQQFFQSTKEFLDVFPKLSFQNEAILIKGARKFRFEKISNRLQQKAHQTVLEINLQAMVNNLNVYRSYLKPGVKTMVMVKAFSYGSGSFEIANALEFHKVDYLAVAYADEGIELRKAGITLPIMVMNPEPQAFEGIIEYELEPEIYSLEHLDAFLNTFQNGRLEKPIPIHLMLDTGMHRLGFEPPDIPELCKKLRENSQVEVASIFSHLAASDVPGEDTFTKSQVSSFEGMSRQIQDELSYPILRHILNTSGILRFPEAQYDMVRLGLGFYGIDVTGTVADKLETPGVLKTTISQVKHLKPGETVGYGRKGKIKENKTIATIAIGYADGFNRLFSNGNGYVMINGQKVPVIGDVCMDMTMVDITGIEAHVGDEAIIFGEKPKIEELAGMIGTIPYEILTNVSQRVKRVYFNE